MKDELEFYGGRLFSLVPVGIYTIFCITLFIFLKAFNMEALAVGGFLALLFGGLFCKDYGKFWDSVINGISSKTSVSVIVILLLVGMFSSLIKTAGLSNGFLWLASEMGVSGSMFVVFTFIAVCIVSTATGSSIGTMFITYPIFYGSGVLLGANEALLAGAIISGAIFGDNLAPISDTTIASASTQSFSNGRPSEIGGVVKSRLVYSLISATITIIFYAVFGGVGGTYVGGDILGEETYKSLVMLIPVAIMLFVTTKTKNIFKGVLVGLTLGTLVGLVFGLFDISAVFANDPSHNEITGYLVSGINSILPTCALVVSIFGIMGVLTDAGMLDYVTDKILNSKHAKTESGAELICVLGTAVTTVLFGGVTSASILTFGPIFNKICSAKNIHPYRRANLLDATANSMPALVPFLSVFVFIGSALTGLSPVKVALGSIYGMALSGVVVFSAITGFARTYEK
ncbi:MAG: Na+/H+ antiporter NhaC family protein [Clostridia bacterium]